MFADMIIDGLLKVVETRSCGAERMCLCAYGSCGKLRSACCFSEGGRIKQIYMRREEEKR
jgi:hypothetical protein